MPSSRWNITHVTRYGHPIKKDTRAFQRYWDPSKGEPKDGCHRHFEGWQYRRTRVPTEAKEESASGGEAAFNYERMIVFDGIAMRLEDHFSESAKAPLLQLGSRLTHGAWQLAGINQHCYDEQMARRYGKALAEVPHVLLRHMHVTCCVPVAGF